MTTSSEHRTVLIVEDEWILRWQARDIVESAGFDAMEAANGDEALRILAEHPGMDVLFTDINMPGSLDGLQLAHQVHASYPAMKLIITSGKVAPAEEEIPDEGVFIPKPYTDETVTRHLSGMFA